jgi:tetratricopeptide (TPR) repeat protein
MADTQRRATDLFQQASSVYQSGDIRQALQLLDEAIASLPVGDTDLRPFLLLQKAGWLRESGNAQAGAKTLEAVARELVQHPGSGHETEWSALRMEQGLVAQLRRDLEAAEALFAEAATLAKQSPARDFILTDVFANQASLYLDQGRLSDARDVLFAALEIDQRVGNKRSESNDLNMLGLVHQRLGDADAAWVYLRKAYEVGHESGWIRQALDALTNLALLVDDVTDSAGAGEIFKNLKSLRQVHRSGTDTDIADDHASLDLGSGHFGIAVSSAISGRIFISYRRQESSGVAGRLYDRIAARFGDDQVFMDVDTIQPGADFAQAIIQAVSACEVLLAVIGPQWVTVANEAGQRRLDDPDDMVRLEIAAALERDIFLIPILVDRAVVPHRHELPEGLAGLVRRNALSLRHESFRSDSERLLTAIERIVQAD